MITGTVTSLPTNTVPVRTSSTPVPVPRLKVPPTPFSGVRSTVMGQVVSLHSLQTERTTNTFDPTTVRNSPKLSTILPRTIMEL